MYLYEVDTVSTLTMSPQIPLLLSLAQVLSGLSLPTASITVSFLETYPKAVEPTQPRLPENHMCLGITAPPGAALRRWQVVSHNSPSSGKDNSEV